MQVKYIRVSTEEQNTARQENFEGKVYVDKCSGTIEFMKREAGKKLYNAIQRGEVTKVSVHSIDRLGRNAYDVQSTINWMIFAGVEVVTEDLGISSNSPLFKMLTDLMANFAEMENNTRKQRQAEGIAIAKAKGKYKGRKASTKLTDEQTLEKNEAIVNCLKAGMSLTKTAETTGKSKPTVIKIKKILEAQKD